MNTLFATVRGPEEAEDVVRRLIATGVHPTGISVIGPQGTPLSLPAEQAATRRAIIRGLAVFTLLGGVVGLLCGMLTLHIPGLGNMAIAPGAHAGPLASMLVMLVAGMGFGAVVGFLANAVSGEESMAPYAERLRVGDLAVVVDEHRVTAGARELLGRLGQSRPLDRVVG